CPEARHEDCEHILVEVPIEEREDRAELEHEGRAYRATQLRSRVNALGHGWKLRSEPAVCATLFGDGRDAEICRAVTGQVLCPEGVLSNIIVRLNIAAAAFLRRFACVTVSHREPLRIRVLLEKLEPLRGTGGTNGGELSWNNLPHPIPHPHMVE